MYKLSKLKKDVLIMFFNLKANDDDAAGIDWSLEADRQMVSNMVIKMAEVRVHDKVWELHVGYM